MRKSTSFTPIEPGVGWGQWALRLDGFASAVRRLRLAWLQSAKTFGPQVSRIKAPLYAINFADDLINATDLGVMQRLVPSVAHGRFVEVPETHSIYGHRAIFRPNVRKPYIAELLSESATHVM